MKEQDVISSLCAIVSFVGKKKYHSSIEHDCFCDGAPRPFESVHPEIIAFINNAVCEKLAREEVKQ